MKNTGNSTETLPLTVRALGLLAIFILVVYSHTFSVSWKLDDLPNIVENPRLHLQTIDSDSLAKTLAARPTGGSGLYRPVACLSFALNWYFGQDRVFGYHVVNLGIHLSTGIFLYLVLVNLYRTPKLARQLEPGPIHAVALVAATLWAINPVHTQAVNYIVQRMTTLAAFFSILGIFFFVKARLSNSEYRRGAFFIACATVGLLALGSKENAAILPLSLVLIEFVFFHNPGSLQKNKWLSLAILLAGAAVFGLAFIFYDLDPLFFLKGYAGRSFSLSERLLTESRIIVFYLSQLIYPHPDRLSIVHEFEISHSLFAPWTTPASILLIAGLVGLSLLRINKNPIVSFALLFFFLNHLIESTVIPLELVFEHRNYLPSFFLSWPVAVGFHRLLLLLRKRERFCYTALAAGVILLIHLGLWTHWRTEVWTSDKAFWEDALRKAPGYKRPYQQLANYYTKDGQLDKAVALLEQSKNLKDENPRVGRIVYYTNMGYIYLQKGDYEKAIEYCRALLAIEPGHRICRGNLVLALMKSRRWAQASAHIDFLLKKRYDNYQYPNLKGLVLVQMHQLADAHHYFRQALNLAPLAPDTLVNFCASISLMGEYERAHTCLSRAMQFHPQDRALTIRLAENAIRRGNLKDARSYLVRLQEDSNMSLRQMLNEEAENIYRIPPSEALLLSAMESKAQHPQIPGKFGLETGLHSRR